MSNPQYYAEATQFLSAIDDDWANLIATVGACGFTPKAERDPYEALVRAVAYQQLHTKAGDAILGKFIQHFGQFPPPEKLIAAEFDDLRACGFSGRKIQTLKGIANGAMSGLVPPRDIADTLTNEVLITRLVTLKGIGQWTMDSGYDADVYA